MIHKEYAIQPETAAEQLRLQFFEESFGFDRGRLIVEFPKQWTESVIKLSDTPHLKEMQLSRIIEKLNRMLRNKLIVPKTLLYRSDWTWVENVLVADKHSHGKAFHGIILEDPPKNNPRCVGFEDLSPDNPLWKRSTGIPCARTTQAMVQAASTLLKCSDEVHFVDPYFHPDERRFTKPLRGFLNEFFSGRTRAILFKPRLTYHLSGEEYKKNWLDKRLFERLCKSCVAPLIPHGCQMEFHRWLRPMDRTKDRMHPRYILTNLGGIKYDQGLETGDGTTPVMLLSEEIYNHEWKNYVLDPEFERKDPFPILVAGELS